MSKKISLLKRGLVVGLFAGVMIFTLSVTTNAQRRDNRSIYGERNDDYYGRQDRRYGDRDDDYYGRQDRRYRNRHSLKHHQKREKRALKEHQRYEREHFRNSRELRRHQKQERRRLKRHQKYEKRGRYYHSRRYNRDYYDDDWD